MSTVAIKSSVEKAKYRDRIERRACRGEAEVAGQPVGELPNKIVLKQKYPGGPWWAHTDKHQPFIHVVYDKSPDAALNRLMIQMNCCPTDPVEIKRLTGLVHSMRAPSCDIRQFDIKPDLDDQQRYVVDFTSNVRMTRGDFERLFGAVMRRGDLDGTEQGSDG